MSIEPQENVKESPDRWQLFRDLVVFQFKLALDGLRDVVLLPLSLIATLAGLILSPDNPGKYFNRLLGMGRRSDIWINLFGATEHYRKDDEAPSSDAYISKLEDMLVAEYRRGGVVKNLKDGTDRVLDQLRKDAARSKTPKPGEPPDASES